MTGSLSLPVRKAVVEGLASHFDGLALFNDQADDREVDVDFGYNPRTKASHRVYTARSTFEHEPAGMRTGRVHRDELGTFDLIARVEIIGGSLVEAEERADEIQVVCEEWIADHKNSETLGLEGLLTLTCRGGTSDHGPIDSGAAALRILTVQWTARLT